MKKLLNFLHENNEFFRSFYFDIAPILLIPPYQTPLIRSERIENGKMANFTHEYMANALSSHTSPRSDTQTIYFTNLDERTPTYDLVSVQAFGYESYPRVHYETVFGGDGRFHNVPVEWDEYIPVQKTSKIKIMKAENFSKTQRNENGEYLRGYIAYPVKE